MKAALIIAAFALIACEGQAAGNAAFAEPELTPAMRLAQAAGARGEAPTGDYACGLLDPDHPAADPHPYGVLSIRGEVYRLRLESAHVLSGQIHSTPAGQLIWNGPLGPIDAAPRRIARARVTTGDDSVSLVFDFAPAVAGNPPSTQLACVMSVAASI